MKKMLLKIFGTFPCINPRAVYLMGFFFLVVPPDFVFAQSVVVTGTENNVNISRLKLSVGSESFEQVSPQGNTNPLPIDVPVLIESVVLEDGEEIFVTSRRPEVVNPNPALGTNRISPHSVEIIRSNQATLGHTDPEFLSNLVEVVSTADLRSYWSIGSQPSIPTNESFVDLKYPFPSSGYIMFSERNGNSSIDFIPLGVDGRPIRGATTVQIRGYQWDTGINHVTDNPSQKQWLVVFSASLFNTLQPVTGVRIVSINEPDGKLVFFVGNISAAPDQAGPINNLTDSKAVLNVLENDELNDGPVHLFDVDLSVITPFPENTLTFNEDGTVDVPAGTPAGTYTMTYRITDIVGGETDETTVTVRVFEMMPEANDDNGGEITSAGADAVVNVLDNDLINGEAATLENVALSEVSNNTNGILKLNADGAVDVAAGAPSGIYQLTYRICDLANTSKCDTAFVSVYVGIKVIDAVDDDFGIYNQNGVVGNVLVNDRINGIPVSPSQVAVSLTDKGGLTAIVLQDNGVLRLSESAAPGSYVLEYELSERLNPANKDVAKVRFVVNATPIPVPPVNDLVAVDDDFGTYDQSGTIGNVLANDTMNGTAVEPAQVLAKVTDNGGLTGLVLEKDGWLRLSGRAAAGSYVLEYELSETLNPDNKEVAKVRFIVNSSTITTVNDAAVTDQNRTVTIAVLTNDETESGVFNLGSLEVTVAPDNGASSVNQDGTITYAPAVNFAGEDRFTYSVCDSEDGTACSTASVTVTVRPISIALTKTVDKTDVSVGETITYTITLTNNSAFTVEEVVVQDLLPELLLYASSSPAPSEADTWIFPRIAPGERFSMTIDALAIASGEALNTATLSFGEFETSATAPTVTIGELPVDLRISKTSHAVEIYLGNEFEYEILVDNVGGSLASEVNITDRLPSGLSYISNSYTATSNAIVPSFSNNGSQMNWAVPSFPEGESLKITLKVKAEQLGSKINSVEVKTSSQEELNPADNVAQDVNEVLGFFIPNVITPGDKDNKNDEFVIKGIERFAANRLVIFNRWGNHVLEADNYQNNWNAAGLSPGSYYYVLELMDSNNKKQTFKGWVQVIKD